MGKTHDYREYLLERLRKNPARAAGYLNAALEEGESTFLVALKDVVDSQQGGVSAAAREAKLNRVSLYKILSDKGNPSLASVEAILAAVGFQLSVKPKKSA